MEIVTNIAEKELAQTVKQDVKKLDDRRAEFKKQALINVMFLYGKHHFTISKSPRGLDLTQQIVLEIESSKNASSNKRTSNYILPLFRSLVSRLISMKANVHAKPMTSTERDRNAAKVSKEVAEEFWQNCNRNNPWSAMDYPGMQAVISKLVLYEMTLGLGYLIPYFNPKAISLLYDDVRKDVVEAEAGEAEMRVASPLNVYRDPYGRFAIEERFLSPEQIEYEYTAKVEPQKKDEDSVEEQISRLIDGESKGDDAKDGALIREKYCIPTADYPRGRKIVCTDSKVLFDGELPSECRNKIPLFEFRYQDLGFSSRGQGAIEQVIDLQQDYNFTLGRIYSYKKLLTGKVLAPRGAKLSAKYDDEVGQILYYASGMRPSYEGGAGVPAYFYEEIKRIRTEMENLMNSHHSSMGQDPQQVKSGVAISNLSALDNQQISPELIMLEQKLGFAIDMVLNIVQERYNERRLLTISGDDMALAVKSFIGSDLFGQKRIKISMGSAMPNTLPERQSYIMMLADKQYISKDRAKELLELGDIDGVYTTLDETGAKQDLLNIIEGEYHVIAEPWEDATVRIKVINDFRKGSVYQKLPDETKQRINDLAAQYQDMLLNESQAAARMGGPLPPAALPPQTVPKQ